MKNRSKVSIVRCNSYSPEEAVPSVDKAFSLLGGLELFIKPKERVLLKPNMLSASLPEEGKNTHIEIVRACIRLVKKCGGIPLIGDNPGGSVIPKEAYERSKFLALAEEEGVELLESKHIKIIRDLPISSYFFECDKIINIPKMKTHSLMILTGAIKNMYGAVSGLNKTHYHKVFPRPEDFYKIPVDVFENVKPTLNLMDGVVAMDGNGPASGRLRDVKILLASEDAVSLDTIFCKIVGLDPEKLLTNREAYKRGIGNMHQDEIDIVGEKIEDIYIKDFRLPDSQALLKLPDFLLNILTGFIKFGLYINKRNCVKCMICKDSCPVDCITINGSTSKIDQKKCIRCMCCHELCPHNAVSIKRNILAKALGV
ncbi:MAG: DUF362 domain-containing protein [Candidatus Omnitrophota bacterium]